MQSSLRLRGRISVPAITSSTTSTWPSVQIILVSSPILPPDLACEKISKEVSLVHCASRFIAVEVRLSTVLEPSSREGTWMLSMP